MITRLCIKCDMRYLEDNRLFDGAVQYKDHKKTMSLKDKKLTVCQYFEKGKEKRRKALDLANSSFNKFLSGHK